MIPSAGEAETRYASLHICIEICISSAAHLGSIPATSAPSERIFSLAGAVVNARRSSLFPRVVDKTMFVYENVSDSALM